MSTITSDRIVELWPSLSTEAREKLVTIAERIAGTDEPLELSPDEERMLAQARDDFAQGRTLSMGEFKADLDGFIGGLGANAKTP